MWDSPTKSGTVGRSAECCTSIFICDLLSQNEHKAATAAIQIYYRFKFFIMQALE